MSAINNFIQSIAKSIEVKQQLLANEALIQNIADATNQIIAAVKRGNRVIFACNDGSAAAYFDPLSPESMRKAKDCALRDDGWL
jgi:hypothetical protein